MQPKIVSPSEWVEARKQFLIKEKEFTRLRDELSRERRELPWERVDKNYVFDGSNGKVKLADLFDGRNQLVVYHFMFGPDWAEGCPSCSFEADHFNSFIVHLNARDVSFGVAGVVCADRGLQEATGMELQLGVVGQVRLQSRLPRVVYQGRDGEGQGGVPLRPA